MFFQFPVKDCVITSHFNDFRDYSKIAPKKLQLHEGVDFASSSPAQIPILASRGGAVAFKGYDRVGYGNFIILKHSDRFLSLYAHMSETLVTENEEVIIGQQIGIMGATGNATGRHLHFNIQDLQQGLSGYVYARVVDPLPLLVNKIDSCIISNLCYNVISTANLITGV